MIRGEIYWASLAPRSGSEQSGLRPVLILSHDAFNTVPSWNSIIVVPLSTSERQLRRGPTAILFSRGTAGLKRASVALCHQVTTLDRSKLVERIGHLSPAEMKNVEEGLRAALGMR